MKVYKEIIEILINFKKINGFFVVFALSLANGLFDILLILSIFNFVAFLDSELNLSDYKSLEAFGVILNQSMNFYQIAVLTLSIIFLSSLFKILHLRTLVRYTYSIEVILSERVLSAKLLGAYSTFVSDSQFESHKRIFTEVGIFINQGVLSFGTLISASISFVFISAGAFGANFQASLVMFISVAVFYGIVFSLVRKRLVRVAEKRSDADTDRYALVSEVFQNVKYVKVNNLVNIAVSDFERLTNDFSIAQATFKWLGQFPRYAIEGLLLFVGVGALVIVSLSSLDVSDVVDISSGSAILVAFLKIMPGAQQIYRSIAQLRYASPTVSEMAVIVLERQPATKSLESRLSPLDEPNFRMSVSQVSFFYESSSISVLKNVSFTANSGDVVGIFGPSGCGKTTLCDIISGLLAPNSGCVAFEELAGGQIFHPHISYAPQSIFLRSTTLLDNLAGAHIQSDAFNKLCVMLVDFEICEDLETAAVLLNSNIHDYGNNFSGGQRQRLGIIRALFADPDLLILDEPTSALNNEISQNIMNTIEKFKKRSAITIVVSHDLNVSNFCNILVNL